MKIWKKTAVFAAFAALVCATVYALSPDELLLQAVREQNIDNLNNAIRQGANPNCTDTSDKSALMYACENQWYAGLKVLLTTPGINVSQKNMAGQNAIMYVVKHCNNEVILNQILADATVNKNDKDNFGNTVLMYAIENKSETPVDLLLKAGADITPINKDGYDALMWAAKHKNGYATKRILDSSSYINWNQCDIKSSSNAFMIACENGSLDLVRMMITGNNGFDPCWKNSKGQPSLIWLIDTRKSPNIIKYVMEYCKPDMILSMTDDFGNDVEYYANIKENDFVLGELRKIERRLEKARQTQEEKKSEKSGGAQQMKKILLLILCPLLLFSCKTTDIQPTIPAVSEEEALFSRLKECVMENDAAALRLVADDTAPKTMRSVINATELEGGQTLLHVAVLNESPEIVEILLKSFASKSVKNKAGKTPADYAKKSENRTIRELFGIKDESKKPQPSSEKVLPGFTDASGDYEIIFGATDSLLIKAIKDQDYAVAKKLLQNGANVNDSDALGNNGLFYALSSQNSAIINLLLENNINCNSRNKNGKLAFLYAVDKGSVSTITTLLNAGASVNKPDSEGMTAELIAVRKRNGALLKFLESKGADLSSTDAKGNTLLHIAVRNDDIVSAKFLLENGCDIYATNDAGVSVLDLMKKSRHSGIRALADDYE